MQEGTLRVLTAGIAPPVHCVTHSGEKPVLCVPECSSMQRGSPTDWAFAAVSPADHLLTFRLPHPPSKSHHMMITRSVGALRNPTSSWRPFGPLDFVLRALRPLRPVGWPAPPCIPLFVHSSIFGTFGTVGTFGTF